MRQVEVEGLYSANFRAACLRVGNFRTLAARVVEKSLNHSAVCASLHCGPLETTPLPGHDSAKAATALLLKVESVLVCTVYVFSFVPDLENTLWYQQNFSVFTTQGACDVTGGKGDVTGKSRPG